MLRLEQNSDLMLAPRPSCEIRQVASVNKYLLKPNNLTFNAQFNFCYPQPFQVSSITRISSKPNSQRSRSFASGSSPIRFYPTWLSNQQKNHSPCRESRLEPLSHRLGFYRGGKVNLAGFLPPSINSFEFFQRCHSRPSCPSVAGWTS